MSRSGYDEDCDDWRAAYLYRANVSRAIAGKRGQAFSKEMLAALDALPEKKLVAEALVEDDGSVCAIGAVGKARGIDMSGLDPEEADQVARAFNITEMVAREIVYMNDEHFWRATPERRFEKMRAWVASQIRPDTSGMRTER